MFLLNWLLLHRKYLSLSQGKEMGLTLVWGFGGFLVEWEQSVLTQSVLMCVLADDVL